MSERPRSRVRRPPSPGSSKELHRSHSFIVDEHDVDFGVRLRTKSLIGETPHPIVHQLAEKGRVNIPVGHIPEEDNASYSSTTIYPELPESLNYARKYGSQSTVSKKTSPTRPSNSRSQNSTRQKKQPEEHSHLRSREYDPRNYEDGSSLINNSLDYKPVVDHEKDIRRMVSDYKDGEFETGAPISSTAKPKTENEIDSEKEMAHQDDFMKVKYKLHRFLIIPDGNCLYRAIAQACLLDQNQHSVLRQLAIDHIREHREEFKELVEGNIDVFLKTALTEGEWAGYPEILALSRVLDVNINITTGGSFRNPKVQVMLHYFKPSEDKAATYSSSETYTQRDSIWLSWLSSGHYDTFTDKPVPNPAYNEWLTSRQSTIESDAAMANKLHRDDTNKADQLHKNRDEFYPNGTTRLCAEDRSNMESYGIIDNSYGQPYGFPGEVHRSPEHAHDNPSTQHAYSSSSQCQNSPHSTSHVSREGVSMNTNYDADLAMSLNNEFDELCQYLERNRRFDIA